MSSNMRVSFSQVYICEFTKKKKSFTKWCWPAWKPLCLDVSSNLSPKNWVDPIHPCFLRLIFDGCHFHLPEVLKLGPLDVGHPLKEKQIFLRMRMGMITTEKTDHHPSRNNALLVLGVSLRLSNSARSSSQNRSVNQLLPCHKSEWDQMAEVFNWCLTRW